MPRFSIVIPTRNRYITLKHAMQSVLHQNFTDFELVVSDNSDSHHSVGIESLKEYFGHEKVKYIRPEKVLSMSDHWEFAVSNAIGEFVIVIGDDDGLVSGSLQIIDRVINQTRTDLVSWARVEYSWPDRNPSQFANQLVFPLPGKTGLIDGTRYIKKIINHKADYRYLPMLYNSAVRQDLIASIKERTGRLFSALSPDIYSGFAFAHLKKKYISIGYPLSINGVSSASNGAAHLNKEKSVSSDFWSLSERSSIKWPKSLPDIYTDYLGIIEPFVQLSMYYPELTKYLSRKQIYKKTIETLGAATEQKFAENLKKILESANDDKVLSLWVKKFSSQAIYKSTSNTQKDGYSIGFIGSHLILDGACFNLNNVYDVSVFMPKILGTIKDTDFCKNINQSLFQRLKRAFGVVKNGY